MNEIFYLKETRKVNGNHTISWDHEIYSVTPPEGISLKGRKKKDEVKVEVIPKKVS